MYIINIHLIIEDWFKLGPIEVPMTEEEEDSLLEATSTDSLHKV